MTDGYHTATIVSPAGELKATFVPEANMLCCALAHRGVDLLPPGRGVRRYAEEGKTMGIPLLYPWANRLAKRSYRAAGQDVTLPAPEGRYSLDPNDLPRHGALPQLLRWALDVDPADGGGDGGRLVGRLSWDRPELLELFPFPHSLTYEAQVAENELTVTVTICAADGAVPVAFGLHPYLHLPEVPRRDWRVNLGAGRRLLSDALMIPTGESEPLTPRDFVLGEMSWDAGLCDLTDPPQFSVGDGGRRLRVIFDEGFEWAQVYAPTDQDVICFEPMTAPTNALVSGHALGLVDPGQEYRASFRIVVADNETPPV